jgi:hypothetical protein
MQLQLMLSAPVGSDAVYTSLNAAIYVVVAPASGKANDVVAAAAVVAAAPVESPAQMTNVVPTVHAIASSVSLFNHGYIAWGTIHKRGFFGWRTSETA